MRRRTARIASLTFASGLALSPLALFGPASAAEEPESQQFTTVGTNNFVVPDDITCVQFQVDGASGGDGEGAAGAAGGNGGRVSGWYESIPGESLSVQVGGQGGDGSTGGNGGIGGTLGIAGGDGGEYNDALDPEPELELTGGGGGGGSALVANFIIATAGAGGGGGAGPIDTPGGGGGNGDVGGDPGAGSEGGLGGAAGESASGIGESADVLGDPPQGQFFFYGGGGGGGGGNGGGAGGSIYAQLSSAAAGGGGGGWNFFAVNSSVIDVSESTAPPGNGQITLTWQEGFTGDCGDDWDPVDGDGDGGGDGGDTNAGSTFDTGVTPNDSSDVLPLIGLVEGALIATAGAAVLITTRRRATTSSEEAG